jgi:hypothetical protein
LLNGFFSMVLASAFGFIDAHGQEARAQVGEVETQRITRSTAAASNPFSSLVSPDPYYVNLSSGYTHTTNAFSDFREQEDWLLDTNLCWLAHHPRQQPVSRLGLCREPQ